MNVLVLNSGSSSMKLQLIETVSGDILITGLIQRIGGEGSTIEWELKDGREFEDSFIANTHKDALDKVFSIITESKRGAIKDLNEINAIGHRVVHGGEKFKDSVLINDEVLDEIKKCSSLAPLHNPANITGIEACAEILGTDKPQVAVFDTSFHAFMPEKAYLYPLPYSFYEDKQIRRYGFHGTSHKYVSQRAIEILNLDKSKAKIISCHLGNGASIAAIEGDISVDTSMGLTPLEGVMMGTRVGDMDPAITLFLMDNYGYSSEELNNIYNKKSGLLGLSEISNDMRDIVKAMDEGNKKAKAAFDVYVYKIKKYIGSYLATLNGADAIVFTAGVAENSPLIRALVCGNMDSLGIKIDDEINSKANRKEIVISAEDSKVKVMVIPTNEELMIATETGKIVK